MPAMSAQQAFEEWSAALISDPLRAELTAAAAESNIDLARYVAEILESFAASRRLSNVPSDPAEILERALADRRGRPRKLTPQQTEEMERLFSEGNLTGKELAARFEVSRSMVYRVRDRSGAPTDPLPK